jgi:hypothetical protein
VVAVVSLLRMGLHFVVWAAETTLVRSPILQDGEVKMAILEWFFMVL